MAKAKTKQQLTIENEELQARLQELEDTLEAIRSGAVDAIVTSGPAGDRVYTLEGADHAYHTMVESMNEGAVTVLTDGTILYANRQFGQMTGAPPSDIVGRPFHDFVQASDRPIWDGFIRQAGSDGLKAEIRFGNRSASEIPVQISGTPIDLGGSKALALVVTDLTKAGATRKSSRPRGSRATSSSRAWKGSPCASTAGSSSQAEGSTRSTGAIP